MQCEQITTLNKSDFNNATYIGEINEDIMQKIEIALANQLGLSIQVPSLETLQAFIEKLANAKAEEMKVANTKITDDYVSSLADKLESIFNIPSTNTVSVENSSKSIKPETNVVAENNMDSDNTKQDLSTNKSNDKNTSCAKRVNKKWSKEDMIVFMQDTEKLSVKEMSEKYNMSVKSIYSAKYRFKNILNDSKEV